MRSPTSPLCRSAAALFAATLTVAVSAQQVAGPTDRSERFEREVRPLLAQHRHECHGAEKQKSGLRLDHGSFARRGGERGPAIVPGDAGASRLVRAVAYDDAELQMPPRARLSDAELAVLVRWVDEGAYWPDEPPPEERRSDGF